VLLFVGLSDRLGVFGGRLGVGLSGEVIDNDPLGSKFITLLLGLVHIVFFRENVAILVLPLHPIEHLIGSLRSNGGGILGLILHVSGTGDILAITTDKVLLGGSVDSSLILQDLALLVLLLHVLVFLLLHGLCLSEDWSSSVTHCGR